jgi:hypothetical protein
VGSDTTFLIENACKLPVECDMVDPDQQFTSNIFHGDIHEQNCFHGHEVLNNTLDVDSPECINKFNYWTCIKNLIRCTKKIYQKKWNKIH